MGGETKTKNDNYKTTSDEMNEEYDGLNYITIHFNGAKVIPGGVCVCVCVCGGGRGGGEGHKDTKNKFPNLLNSSNRTSPSESTI